MFDKNYKLENYQIVEFKFLPIFDDLYVTGIGGSISGYDKSGQKAFEGFPW